MWRRAVPSSGGVWSINAAIDALLYSLSVYAVPIAVGAVTLIAVVAWERQYPTDRGDGLDIRVFEQVGSDLAPAQALVRLRSEAPVTYRDTRLSESPFWFSFVARPSGRGDRPFDPGREPSPFRRSCASSRCETFPFLG